MAATNLSMHGCSLVAAKLCLEPGLFMGAAHIPDFLSNHRLALAMIFPPLKTPYPGLILPAALPLLLPSLLTSAVAHLPPYPYSASPCYRPPSAAVPLHPCKTSPAALVPLLQSPQILMVNLHADPPPFPLTPVVLLPAAVLACMVPVVGRIHLRHHSLHPADRSAHGCHLPALNTASGQQQASKASYQVTIVLLRLSAIGLLTAIFTLRSCSIPCPGLTSLFLGTPHSCTRSLVCPPPLPTVLSLPHLAPPCPSTHRCCSAGVGPARLRSGSRGMR